jgi:hypothetical protein
VARLIDRLHRHAAREARIADERRDVVRLALAVARDGHAERGRQRRGGVPRAERVVLRLVAAQKAAQAVVLLDGRERVAPPRQNFMRVGLVADVPDEAVGWRLESVMEGDGEFDRAQARARVPADARHRLDDVLADFGSHLRQLFEIQPPQVGGRIDVLDQVHGVANCNAICVPVARHGAAEAEGGV